MLHLGCGYSSYRGTHTDTHKRWLHARCGRKRHSYDANDLLVSYPRNSPEVMYTCVMCHVCQSCTRA